MRSFSIKSSYLNSDNRLIPLFYYYKYEVRRKNEERGIRYEILGELSSLISDGEHSQIKRLNEGDVRYLYGRNIREGTIDYDPISDDPFISKIDYDNNKRCHIAENDVLIAIYGTVGKSAVYHESYVGVAGIPRHIANIRLKENCSITPEYLTLYFRSKAAKWQMNSMMTGNLQQLLKLKDIRKMALPIPDDEFIKRVTLKEKRGIECEEKAQVLINQATLLFYDAIKTPIKEIKEEEIMSVKFSDIDSSDMWTPKYYGRTALKVLDLLKSQCSICTLRDIVDIRKGDEVGRDNYNEYIDRSATDVPFIRTSDIVNNEVDLYPDYYVKDQLSNEINQDNEYKDVLLTKDGKVGAVAMITAFDKVILSSGVVSMKINTLGKKLGITPEYLFAALLIKEIGYYAAIRRTVIASTIPHLREDRLKDIEIPIIPSIIEKVTSLIEEAFKQMENRKKLLKENEKDIESYLG